MIRPFQLKLEPVSMSQTLGQPCCDRVRLIQENLLVIAPGKRYLKEKLRPQVEDPLFFLFFGATNLTLLPPDKERGYVTRTSFEAPLVHAEPPFCPAACSEIVVWEVPLHSPRSDYRRLPVVGSVERADSVIVRSRSVTWHVKSVFCFLGSFLVGSCGI